MEPKIVKVKVLDPNLQKHNGFFMHVGYARALDGEAKGIWKIVDGNENEYDNKSMTSRDMETKTTFSNTLSRKNLFH